MIAIIDAAIVNFISVYIIRILTPSVIRYFWRCLSWPVLAIFYFSSEFTLNCRDAIINYAVFLKIYMLFSTKHKENITKALGVIYGKIIDWRNQNKFPSP